MKRKSRTKSTCSNNKSLRFVPSVKKGVATVFKWGVAVLLLPLVWASFYELIVMVPKVGQHGFHAWWVYAAGIVFYFGFDRVVTTPMTLYVFGHELTHVLSGLLSGAKIHSFKAKSSGGEVRLSKTNTFIALSPYIVPLYSLMIAGLYCLIRHFWSSPALAWAFQFLLGSSLSFHILMTIRAIHKRQTDLKPKGLFLSTVLIAIGNALIVSLFFMALFSKTPNMKVYGKGLIRESARAWTWGFDRSRDAFVLICSWIR